MKNYIQFFHLSTGYNQEQHDFSAPKKNITMCGSDGVQYYDGRHNLSSILTNMRKNKNASGFCIIKNNRVIFSEFSNNLKVEL